MIDVSMQHRLLVLARLHLGTSSKRTKDSITTEYSVKLYLFNDSSSYKVRVDLLKI